MPAASKPGDKAAESNPSQTSAFPDREEFEWLQYQDSDRERVSMADKLMKNPFVPIGAAATVIALTLGLYNLRKKNPAKQQFYMRARVGAQGFTVASLIGGLFYEAAKEDKSKERDQART